jgi:hypothetical protein
MTPGRLSANLARKSKRFRGRRRKRRNPRLSPGLMVRSPP